MSRQELSSDKVKKQIDGSSGINLMVLIKVLGNKCSDCSMDWYPVFLDQTHWPFTWAVQIPTGRLCGEEHIHSLLGHPDEI